METRKPLIGINAEFYVNERNKTTYSYVPAGYFDSVIKAGAVPVLIPPYSKGEDIEQILGTVDGVVMIGGADLDPQKDGYMWHSCIKPMAERRETFDRLLIDRIAKRRIPLFAIGAGMQLLNVSQGGTLLYHIPEDLPNALPHRDSMDPNHRHALEVTPGSLMEKVYGENEIRVNSMHHMAVDDVAPGFLLTARCPDGVAEAIESIQDDWFAFGTQFHPEAPSATALDIRLFHEFVQGIVESRGLTLAAENALEKW
ncbi:MAG: gamma-glutamyl-gamma-aminobutyrate hydrolase family protein [Planctomycetaceae bacterium]|nr:gamma-glutamyl-gamma-aminobutyrate hydrolase family protein [Planctomycetaceae bacterium]